MLGSANMDHIVRQPRPANPGETIIGSGFMTVPGGRGLNQAVAAARLGASVDFLGAVGTDAHGSALRALLAAEGIRTAGLATVPGATGTAHIAVVETGENSIVVVPGANAAVTGLSEAQRATIAGASHLLLQCELPVSALVAGVAAARSAGVFTVFTPGPFVPLPDGFLAGIDLVVSNRRESATLSGESDPVRAAEVLSADGIWAIVTLSAEGCVVAFSGSVLGLAPARPVRAVDTTAAGDTFVGALVARLAAGTGGLGGAGAGAGAREAATARAGADVSAGPTAGAAAVSEAEMIEAVRWATVASSLSVTRPGATSSIPTLAEVTAILR